LKATQNVRGKRREQVVLLEIAKALVGNHFATAILWVIVLPIVSGRRAVCTDPNLYLYGSRHLAPWFGPRTPP
jgi:hypothetical protein